MAPAVPARRPAPTWVVAALLLTALAVTGFTGAGRARADAAAVAPPCGQGSWVAGTVELCAGELVYRDYVYDDHGAALSDALTGAPEGLYAGLRVPTDAYGDQIPVGMAELYGVPLGVRDNTADLVALRLRAQGGALSITAELNTMFDGGRTEVVVGIDTDDDTATAAGAVWPDGLVASPFRLPGQQALANRGLDTFVTLRDGDPESNLLRATVPLPPGARWRVQAVAARPVPGSSAPVVMNVAYRGVDERGPWWEDAQAMALAGNDIRAFSTTVDVADLTSGTTRPAADAPGKLRERVYVSATNPGMGEGVAPPGGVASKAEQVTRGFDMLGRYQPYGFYEPPGAGPHGLQLVLHGMGENHSSLLWDPGAGRNPPPIAERFGAPLDRIIAVPLGRGPHGWYSSYSERDVLDVIADIEASYPVDAERVFMSGASLGGYGAMRLAALHPDVFAAVVQWVGATGDSFNGTPLAGVAPVQVGALGNVVDLLGNLRNVPMGALYSGADELVHVNEALAVRDRLAALDVPSVLWLHPLATHSTYSIISSFAKEAAWSAGRTRVADPAHVTFRTDESFFAPEVGVQPDRAYWVSAIVPAGAGFADVDAVSLGCGDEEPVMTTTTETGTDPVPWIAQDIHPVGTTSRPASNRLELTLANVTSLSIARGDPAAAPGSRGSCLNADSLSYHVTTDRPATVTLSDGRCLDLAAGTSDGILPAVSPLAETVAAPGTVATLPATGGGPPAWAPLLLLFGLSGLIVSSRKRRA